MKVDYLCTINVLLIGLSIFYQNNSQLIEEKDLFMYYTLKENNSPIFIICIDWLEYLCKDSVS